MKKKNSIKVSVLCITYNQKDYIAEALESFISQKTNFDFEIVVHDDCSTDGTTDIIREYEKKYPNLIKPIYEKENQYSKVRHILPLCYKYMKGKYVATCEGDDYWCDDSKLQKQYDFMESHKECSCVSHGTYNLRNNKVILPEKRRKKSEYVKEEEAILGTFLHTSSMFYRSEVLNDLPNYFYKCFVGDYPLFLYLSTIGKIYYINEYMSVYRMNAKNSWTEKNKSFQKKDKKKRRLEHLKNVKAVLNLYNIDTNKKYEYFVKIKVMIEEITKSIFLEEFDILKKKKYCKIYKYKHFIYKKVFIVFVILRNFSWIYKLAKKIFKIELINYA